MSPGSGTTALKLEGGWEAARVCVGGRLCRGGARSLGATSGEQASASPPVEGGTGSDDRTQCTHSFLQQGFIKHLCLPLLQALGWG